MNYKIEALFLLNSRGLRISKKIFTPLNAFYSSSELDDILLSIYSDLNFNFPESLPLTILAKDETIKYNCFGSYFVKNSDLLFIFTNQTIKSEEILTHPDIVKFLQKRQDYTSYFRGMVVCDYKEREGPVPIFNESPLTLESQTLLSVQGLTVLGLGSADISANPIAGPLVVPGDPKYSFLVYMYYRPAPDSKDPRIVKSGRPVAIYVIIEQSENVDKEIINFLRVFLEQWSRNAGFKINLLQEDLARMRIDLRQTILLAKDLIKLRSIQESEFRKLLLTYSTENMMLKNENAELKGKLAEFTKLTK